MRTILLPAPASTRRGLLAGAATGLAACATATQPADMPAAMAAVASDLSAYADFGPKSAGGPGDNACGAWIEERLGQAGFATERQTAPANDIAAIGAELRVGPQALALALHDPGRMTPATPIEAPMVVWPPAGGELEGARGVIVIAHLSSRRWSSALAPEITNIIARAEAAGASALVLVTHGPTGELIRLNRPLAQGALPVLLAGPRNWRDIAAASASASATIAIERAPVRRDAFNVIGRIAQSEAPFVVVSTPRSGWGVCAGERGPGVAAFLALAQWARQALPRHNLIFVCTSAHEFENAGAEIFLSSDAPPAERTRLWLHLGAGFAARDWHEAGDRLAPLPSPDPQRFLLASQALLPAARACFVGAPGLEAPYPARAEAQGELGHIVAAGYPSVVGLLGAHRFHHTALDDMRCVEALHAADVTQRLQQLMLMTCGT